MIRALLALALGSVLVTSSPAGAQTAAPPAQQPQPQQQDIFGEEVTLTGKTIVFLSGTGKWESAFPTIVEALRNVRAYLDKQGIKPSGDAMVIYNSADDSGFDFQAAFPIATEMKDPPKGDIQMGKSPEGAAYKFVHRGSYDGMDNTYEAIANFMDQKGLDARETFIEEYTTDPLTAPNDKLVINVFVPIK